MNQTDGKVTYRSSDGMDHEVKGTAFDLYKRELKDGQDVLVRWAADTSRAGVTFDRSLWWRGPNVDGGSYHYVTGAGIDCGTAENPKRVIYFADPDSNKGSARNNAGWNFTANDAGVNGRKYTDTDHTVPIPARGAAKTDDPAEFDKFYGCASFDADGYTISDEAMNERYKHVRIRNVETVCPVKAVVKESVPEPTPTQPNRTRTRLVIESGPISHIDGVILYPISPEIIDMSLEPFPSELFIDPSGENWLEQKLPQGVPDPFGNTRDFDGAFFFTPFGAIVPGETAQVTIFTTAPFEAFDVLLRLRGTGIYADAEWLVQPINNDFEFEYVPQTAFCDADFNQNGAVTEDDIFAFLSAWFAGDDSADINGDGVVGVSDIFAFLALWFSGCPWL